MSNEHELDDLFRKKLEDPVDKADYREEDWEGLEQLLDKRKKRSGIVLLLPYIGSAAAVLLLFLGWLAFRPHGGNTGYATSPLTTIHHHKTNTGTNGGPNRQIQLPTNTQQSPVNYVAKNVANGGSKKGTTVINSAAVGSRRVAAGATENYVQPTVVRLPGETLAAQGTTPFFADEHLSIQQVADISIPALNTSFSGNARTGKPVIRKQAAFHPQYAMTVLAAPDANGVGSSFQQSRLGTNAGLLFSAAFTKKFTVSTGVLYSNKPYVTGFENYHTGYQFPVNPVDVTADCKMLDIPLNVDYQVFNKHQNKISIGTGLSSYIMLNQNFQFNYATPYTAGPQKFVVNNAAGYYFGVLNLDATYTRQVTQKVGVALEPYVKLPLSNIGYSQVHLQSTGLALGLTWRLGR